MGAWGPKLYQDDVAEDVRVYYKEQLHQGKTGTEITQELLKHYEYLLSDPDVTPVFWFALADTQWNLGRLEDFVKKNALSHIHEGHDLKQWEKENPKYAKDRAKVLTDLEHKLLLPQPPEKKIAQHRLYRCEWNIGDVFAYALDSEYAKEKGFFGRYLLLHKVDETIWHPGHIIPIVRIKITTDNFLPCNKEEFEKLDYVQISFRYFDPFVEEFRVDSKNLTEKEFWTKVEEKKATYKFDKFGLLPEYQMKVISTSMKVIPKKLFLIGNFLDVCSPENEFIPNNKIEIPSVRWKDIEKTVIDSYIGHNLRHLGIYSEKN